jgi:histone deacetylase complex regulatory component SIN3
MASVFVHCAFEGHYGIRVAFQILIDLSGMMRELRVEDALLYLDQVKMEFGDRPHIYNEFLDIMKTFKTQQIDTPGVIRRVSNLFQGNKKLVLGFNTFLPEGYKIELPMDGEGPPVALFRPPGTKKYHVLSGPGSSPVPQSSSQQIGISSAGGSVSGQPSTMMSQQGPGAARAGLPTHAQQPLHSGQPLLRNASSGGPPHPLAQHPTQVHARAPQPGVLMGQQGGGMVVDQSSGIGPPFQQGVQMQHGQQQQGAPRTQQGQSQLPGEGAARLPTDPVVRSSGQAHLARPSHLTQANISNLGGSQSVSGHESNGPGAPVRLVQGTHTSQGPRAMPSGAHAHQLHSAATQSDSQVQPPVEFDHAINYVTTIKKRFAAEPETYKKFLEILHTYQKEQRGIKEVLDEVSVLFADHPDLLKEFTYFLPDAVQAQAKAQLDQVAKEAEARKRAASSKQAIMQTAQGMQKQAQVLARPGQLGVKQASSGTPSIISIPFGATQGRSEEREREITRSAVYGNVSFFPMRPPRKNDLTPAQSAQRNGRPTVIPPVPRQPTTSEAAFFDRVKNHLNRKELAPDKPPGSRRHTPYTEFLKCLHLFGAAVLNKEELLLLLRGLFVQGHAPKSGLNAGGGASNPIVVGDAHNLLRDFEEVNTLLVFWNRDSRVSYHKGRLTTQQNLYILDFHRKGSLCGSRKRFQR